MTPKEVLDMAKENGARMVDLRFMDYPGLWQHFSVPIRELEESSFEDGFGFDGSSIRGWQPIHASDMLVIPDADTAKMDPFYTTPTLVLICNIVDPVTREPYTRDPRNIARKAEAYLKSTGIGDTVYIGPEAEFFIFDDIRFESSRFGLSTKSTPSRAPGTPAAMKAQPGIQAAAQGRLFSGAAHGQVPGSADRRCC